jgi:hypothetical protein
MKYIKAPRGFPKQVDILGMRWRVLYSPELLACEQRLGVTRPRETTITLDSTVGAQSMRQTLVHEVIHACFSSNEDNHGLAEEADERVVRALTMPLLSALRDNRPWWR